MSIPQRMPLLLVAALLPGVVLAESLRTFEGESGTPEAGCAPDGETMGTSLDAWASGGQTMFFPNDGCTATYDVGAYRDVVTVVYANGGVGQTALVCGWFEFSGAAVGATPVDCTTSDANRIVVTTADVAPGSGSTLYVTWRTSTDLGTPTYANAFLDYFTMT